MWLIVSILIVGAFLAGIWLPRRKHKQYSPSLVQDGELEVISHGDKKIFRLGIDAPPDELEHKEYILLKVIRRAGRPGEFPDDL
jgi:hypothetical protein